MTKQGGRLCFETTFLLQESDELKVFHHPKCLPPSALMSGVKQKRIFVQRLWLSSFHLTRISCLSFSFKSCRYICQTVLFGASVHIFNRAPVVLYIIPSLSFFEPAHRLSKLSFDVVSPFFPRHCHSNISHQLPSYVEFLNLSRFLWIGLCTVYSW
jgi:hypothetical protein